MKPINLLVLLMAFLITIFLQGCAAPKQYDYSAFQQSKPRSILVLPPLNKSPEVTASSSVLAQVTRPLAESGYYVMPVSLVDETFKENGLTQPSDMHDTSIEKLHEIFGADAALYITVTKYGSVYSILNSETVVALQGKLIDLKNGAMLWEDTVSASSAENNQQQSGGLAGLLISALVKQVLATVNDDNHKYAGLASERLLSAGRNNGILFGPRSPNYGKDPQ